MLIMGGKIEDLTALRYFLGAVIREWKNSLIVYSDYGNFRLLRNDFEKTKMIAEAFGFKVIDDGISIEFTR